MWLYYTIISTNYQNRIKFTIFIRIQSFEKNNYWYQSIKVKNPSCIITMSSLVLAINMCFLNEWVHHRALHRVNDIACVNIWMIVIKYDCRLKYHIECRKGYLHFVKFMYDWFRCVSRTKWKHAYIIINTC